MNIIKHHFQDNVQGSTRCTSEKKTISARCTPESGDILIMIKNTLQQVKGSLSKTMLQFLIYSYHELESYQMKSRIV